MERLTIPEKDMSPAAMGGHSPRRKPEGNSLSIRMAEAHTAVQRKVRKGEIPKGESSTKKARGFVPKINWRVFPLDVH
jgi:hypothetical protein